MKEKIILFVIGILVGAVIASGTFYFYTIAINSNNCNSQGPSMNGGNPPQMPGGGNGQPPARPDDSNNQNNQTQNNQ